MAGKLNPYGFIRIHRSVPVNTSFVEEIQPYWTGSCSLRIKGGTKYTVTGTYPEESQVSLGILDRTAGPLRLRVRLILPLTWAA